MALPAVAGCKNTADPYLTEQHCLRWDSEFTYIPMVNPQGGIDLMPMVQQHCTGGWETTTRPNPDYVPPR